MNETIITGQLVDCFNKTVLPAHVHIRDGRISAIHYLPQTAQNTQLPYILPGFVDAHVHIESSMLVPAGFAQLAVVHGTVATVSDPHEIANVCGLEGVEFMIQNGRSVPFRFYFGAPSCVPATGFETAGATLDAPAVQKLLERPEIKYLSEMMNFPGALQGNPEVLAKIQSARNLGKPVDGHAPGLRGDDARKYVELGIHTDHECFTLAEALEKLGYGMKILIREGSAARNFEALASLVDSHPEMVMFCSDDKHPDSLVAGHINQLCARAVARGSDPFHVIRVACVNPVLHYNLDIGLVREGDDASLVLVNNLKEFKVLETWIGGQLVARRGESLIRRSESLTAIPNQFECLPLETSDFLYPAGTDLRYGLPVIEATDGQLITGKGEGQPILQSSPDGIPVNQRSGLISPGATWCADPAKDLLKIVVVNRYRRAPVAKAFIRNFGLKQGALASSVAHDSHNIVCVGVDDESICRAVNGVIRHRGGISCVKDNLDMVLPLPVAGLMSQDDGYKVAELYTLIDQAAKDAGSTLRAPFMTLSFMALLVIPHLKLSDLGLFDGDRFQLIS